MQPAADTVTPVLQIEVMHVLATDDEALQRFVGLDPRPGTGGTDRAPAADNRGVEPKLNDELVVHFRRGGGQGFTAVTARTDSGRLVGYAQASASSAGFTVGLVVDETIERRSTDAALFGPLFAAIADAGGGEVTWWAAKASADDELLAKQFGMHPARTLLEMRRELPLDAAIVGAAKAIDVRGFVVGEDEHAWLAVNNRAFSGHHEQSGWTLDTLRARQAEPWFMPQDVLLHERDGRLAGFCWTKIHPATATGSGTAGEIYIIGVDPDFTGLGLGRSLAVAGYQHVSARGAATALLYVDEDNATAIRLYESLGLHVSRRDIAYAVVVPAHDARRATTATTATTEMNGPR